MSYRPPRNQWGPPWEFRQGPAKPRPWPGPKYYMERHEETPTVTHTFKDDAGEWKWEHPLGSAYGDPRAMIRFAGTSKRKRGDTDWAVFWSVGLVGLVVVLAALWLAKATRAWDAPRTWTTPEAEVGK